MDSSHILPLMEKQTCESATPAYAGSTLHKIMGIAVKPYILVAVLFLTLHAESVHADLDMKVLPGFDSYHKYGRWLPLRITLASDANIEGEVKAEVQDGITGARQIYSVPITLFRNTRKVQYLYMLPESFRRNLRIRLVDNQGKEVLREDIPLVTIPPEDLLIVAIASRGGGLGMSERGAEMSAGKGLELARVHVSYPSAELLPDKWKGYDSVDMIVLGDASMSAFSADQRRAITDWVYGGGRLVVSGGAHSQNLIGTFVEELLPVRIDGTRVLSSISSLSRQFGWQADGRQVVVASSELRDGGRAIAAEEGGLPVISEKEIGDGKVIFLAFDYLDPAFRAWNAKQEMWRELLPEPISDNHPGDADIARLFTVRSVRPPSYKPVGLFLLLYALCIGPLNYFIVRSSRAGWTWISIPVVAAVFTIGSLGFTYVTRGRAMVFDDLSIVDVYQEARRARLNSYFSLLSTAKSDYTMEFPASDAVFVNRVSSPNRKIRSSRGMGDFPHQDSDSELIQKDIYKMEVSHIKTISPLLFYGECYVDFDGGVSVNLPENNKGIESGKVTSKLPFDLNDCYVFSNGRYTYIGDLTRGNTVNWTYAGNVPGLYSTMDRKKQRVINAMRQSLSHRITGTGVVGWMNGSALQILAGVDLSEDYKSQGTALVIVHVGKKEKPLWKRNG